MVQLQSQKCANANKFHNILGYKHSYNSLISVHYRLAVGLVLPELNIFFPWM